MNHDESLEACKGIVGADEQEVLAKEEARLARNLMRNVDREALVRETSPSRVSYRTYLNRWCLPACMRGRDRLALSKSAPSESKLPSVRA